MFSNSLRSTGGQGPTSSKAASRTWQHSISSTSSKVKIGRFNKPFIVSLASAYAQMRWMWPSLSGWMGGEEWTRHPGCPHLRNTPPSFYFIIPLTLLKSIKIDATVHLTLQLFARDMSSDTVILIRQNETHNCRQTNGLSRCYCIDGFGISWRRGMEIIIYDG